MVLEAAASSKVYFRPIDTAEESSKLPECEGNSIGENFLQRAGVIIRQG